MSEWDHVAIGGALKLTSGFPFPSSLFSEEEGVPLIRIRDIVRSNIETRYLGKYAPSYLVRRGDVLIGMDGDFNVVRWRNEDALLNQRVLKIEVADRSIVDLDFAFYWLAPYIEKVNTATAATTVKHLSIKDVKKAVGRIPGVVAQRKIAAILTSVDNAIEASEELIEKHQQIKAGLMHDLFNRGVLRTGLLRPSCGEAPNLYVRSPLGHIPVDWSVKALDDLCSLIVDCPHSTPVFQESGVLVARTMHIKSGQFLEDEASRVSEREYQQRIERGAPQAGDLIFTREAPVGEAFVVPDGMRLCLGQRVMLIRPLTGCLEPTYLLHQLYSGSLSSQIRDRTAGTTNPHLNVADVRRLLVPVPPLAEQAAIASSLSSMTQRILADQQILKKLRMQKQGLMQDLLTGKVPVRAD